MSNRHRDRGKLAPFVALFRHTIKSAAWKAASVGARATFFELKASYHTKAQNAVFLSSRDGAESLNVSKDTICKWLRELEHYGFIVKVRGHHLGVDGEGKAALYRLTDCPYAGKPATYDFQNWSSELFEPETAKRTMTEADKKRLTESRRKQKPVLTVRTPRPNGKDIRAEGEMATNGNNRPNGQDIKNDTDCPNGKDISSFTSSPESLADSLVVAWCVPIPNINPNVDEADSRAWVAAWLEQIPAPTLSLAEIRQFMGVHPV
jgi:hypothetical protein